MTVDILFEHSVLLFVEYNCTDSITITFFYFNKTDFKNFVCVNYYIVDSSNINATVLGN